MTHKKIMSDSIEDIVKQYNENVYARELPRSIGLFTIPEYPELEAERGMWSAALDAILTTLRYLAPATLLTLFWGQQSFLFKILKHIDSAFRSIVFSSEEEKQAVLQWLAEAGPVKVEHLDTVWRHGWILCRVLDAALPGACAGHPPTQLSIKHAQTIAENYLGVEPVFTRQEIESNDSLSRHQEWKFATYLDRIREALSKITPPVSKPVSQRTSPEIKEFILDYVAKGCGLSAIQTNNKAHFKIYPTAQQSIDPREITVLIRGPKDAYGMTVIQPILGKAQMIRQKLLGLQPKQTYTENILPVTQGATYLRNFGKNDMHKTYHIPKSQHEIDIDVDSQIDHVKVSYTVKYAGKYQVSITSKSQSIVGSPFTAIAADSILSTLEKDSFCLEDGEEIDIVDVKTDKKVVLRIVDFVTEKMLLKENGSLEKISDEEAKMLISDNNDSKSLSINKETVETVNIVHRKPKGDKFKRTALKIQTMYRVSKIFHGFVMEKHIKLQKQKSENCMHRRNQQDIPDIVNSTFTEINVSPYIVSEKREKFIVPECISVSLIAEKSKSLADEIINATLSEKQERIINNNLESTRLDTPDSLEIQNSNDEDSLSIGRAPTATGLNPFLDEIYEDDSLQTAAERKFGTFVASEYETNNSQKEETKDNSINILIDSNLIPHVPSSLPTLVCKNPFIESDVKDFERPKTPVFKIISGEKINRSESVFVDPKSELYLSEENLGNEFVNPFFIHQFQTDNYDDTPMTDFIIGAPVSLPPMIQTAPPDPEMKSILLTQNNSTEIQDNYETQGKYIAVVSEPVYSRPDNLNILTENKEILTSLGSNSTETMDISNTSTAGENQFESDQTDSYRNVTSRKDLWDSAYVSIDDNSSSPDSNNNNESASLDDKHSPSDANIGLNLEEITNMGPAEREIWQTCNELNSIKSKVNEDIKPCKWEVRRSLFTPIIEESDRSISAGIKDLSLTGICTKEMETDTVSVAFAELNEMYQEYFPISEVSSTTNIDDDDKLYSVEVGSLEVIGISVDSASDISDVKRHENDLEGTISEVQANVTESVSASQILQNVQDHFKYTKNKKHGTQFGDDSYTNIVLEKKKYWDERIREIEAKAQEITVPKKRRISAKQLKHDSLSKRRGKQIIKSFLNAGDYSQVTNVNDDREPIKNTLTTIESANKTLQTDTSSKMVLPDEKLVAKWKKFWDNKLEDQIQIANYNPGSKTSKTKFRIPSPEPIKEQNLVNEINLQAHDSKTNDKVSTNDQFTPIKQELSEEVFKAFETSPKRFFGTSRKQILNKIDTYQGKPVNVDTSTTNVAMCHESGLVSSRISLFHNISNTEELPWVKRKTQSLHDIYHRKESENNIFSTKDISDLKSDIKLTVTNEPATNIRNISQDSSKHERKTDCIVDKTPIQQPYVEKQNQYIRSVYKKANDKYQPSPPKIEALRKKSFSKSEMDIFNKPPSNITTDLDKYKSCDELPKINVKSFISLYESKNTEISKSAKRVYRTSSADSQKTYSNSITSDAVSKHNYGVTQASETNSESKVSIPGVITPTNLWTSKTSETVSNISLDTRTSDSYDVEIIPIDGKDTTYLSLSDIELEIIESSPSKTSKSSPEWDVAPEHMEYKNRFKLAKEYFQSLEELRDVNKPRKLNECELLLRKHSVESLETEEINDRPQKRVKKNIKSHSLPSSEIAKGLNQLQERQERCASEERSNTKLVKISEKFHVEDLFSDVTEGKLSRQGSLRGIPHKKAVLEAFRSMENVSDVTLSSYEIADSHLLDFSKEHIVKNAQTYLNEYPYLPKTDPSKYHSRIDIKASGLISLKELKEKKPRRNSVPDLRLNPNFTVDV